MGTDEPLALLLTGTIGAGKTAVATAAGEILEQRGIPHAVVDLDWLAWAWVGKGPDEISRLMAANLTAIWPNLRAAGATRLIMSRALRGDAEIERVAEALAPTPVSVVRLMAPREVIVDRLKGRDSGATLETHLVESAIFDESLEALTYPHVRVSNDRRPVRDVAREVLESCRFL